MVKFYNSRTVSAKEISNQMGFDYDNIIIDLTGKFLVTKNDMGVQVMTAQEVIEYAQNLVEANPELWHNLGVRDLDEAKNVIHHTLDNERVDEVGSQV